MVAFQVVGAEIFKVFRKTSPYMKVGVEKMVRIVVPVVEFAGGKARWSPTTLEELYPSLWSTSQRKGKYYP